MLEVQDRMLEVQDRMLEVPDRMLEVLDPMFLMEDHDQMVLEVLDPMFPMKDSDLMLEVLDRMQDHSMKAPGKMEEDKLEITMEDSDLMQEDQVDHSILDDPQETPMEGGLMEAQDLEMVIMEADPHPMHLEQEDLSLAVAAPTVV